MAPKNQTQEKFVNQEYPIHFVGKHLEITDAIRTYAEEKLKNIKRFGGRVMEAFIVMEVQKLEHKVDFIVMVNNTKIKVSGTSPTMYASIDEAIAHLEAKLRRYISRLHEHHAKNLSEVDMNVNVLQGAETLLDDINDQIEEQNLREAENTLKPQPIVNRESRPLKTLSQNEAFMKLELSGDRFLLYRSEEDQKLKLLYTRNDGNLGLMEPE